jgi:iron(III) transport system permease protein
MLIGGLGFLIFPWYVTGDGFFSINWIKEYSLEDYGSALPQVFINSKYWLLPLVVPLLFPLTTLKLNQNNPLYSKFFYTQDYLVFFIFFFKDFQLEYEGGILRFFNQFLVM